MTEEVVNGMYENLVFLHLRYPGVTPREFFDMGSGQPTELRPFAGMVKKLSRTQFAGIENMIDELPNYFAGPSVQVLLNKDQYHFPNDPYQTERGPCCANIKQIQFQQMIDHFVSQ